MMDTKKGIKKMRLVIKRLKKDPKYFYKQIEGLKYSHLTTRKAIKIAKAFSKFTNYRKTWKDIYNIMFNQDKQSLVEGLYFQILGQKNIIRLGLIKTEVLQFVVYVDKMQRMVYNKIFAI